MKISNNPSSSTPCPLVGRLADIRRSLERNEAKQNVLVQKFKALRDEHQDLLEKLDVLQDQERLAALVGKTVRLIPGRNYVGRVRNLLGHTGTLVEVKRTRCLVDFDQHGKWALLCDCVQGLDDQSFFLPLA